MKEFITTLGKDGLKAAYSLLESFALYLTIALALTLIVTAIILNAKNKEKLKSFKTLALGIVIGYAITLCACISFLMITRLSVKGEIDRNFYLMLGFFLLLLIYAITAIITKSISEKCFNICNIVGLSVSIAYAIVLLIILPTVDESYKPLSNIGIYISTAVLVAIIALGGIFFDKSSKQQSSTKALSYAGLSISLSFALSYIKLFSLPQGGSVTLASMLPLIIYAYAFGARKGIFAGAIYGVLQCLQNPQIYQPLQVLIDYPIAFATIGLAGIVKDLKFLKTPVLKFTVGASLTCIMRYVSHFISGYFVFSSWAMPGYTALTWSLVYNLYLIAELGIILICGILLFSNKSFSKQLELLN